MKKIFLITIICFCGVIFITLTLRFLVGGSEDDWICQNGEWVEHGVPSAPKPTEPCSEDNRGREEETMTIKVYFNNDRLDPEFSCNKVFPVIRTISKTSAIARATLEELLKGPTEQEKLEGFFTSINPGVKIQKLTIENGTAKVDFNEQLEYRIGGSCWVSAIRWQIIETLKQFSTVNNVVISIDGRTEDILQP